jgi:hypothetical protein
MNKNAFLATAILTPIALASSTTPDIDFDLSGTTIFTSRVNSQYGFLANVDDSHTEHQINVISSSLMEARSSWDIVREAVEHFSHLPAGWGSYDEQRILDQTIENALTLIDVVSQLGGNAEWAEPTSEGAIALQSQLGDSTVTFEVDNSDVVGLAIKNPNSIPIYLDIPLDDVGTRLAVEKI